MLNIFFLLLRYFPPELAHLITLKLLIFKPRFFIQKSLEDDRLSQHLWGLDFKNPINTQIDFYKKYKIQIPFMEWNNKSLIRISIQAYNSKQDVLKLLDALKEENY